MSNIKPSDFDFINKKSKSEDMIMAKIYTKDANGQKVYMEVTEMQAKEYREELRREWRVEANANNNTVSLDVIASSGFDIPDENADIEQILIEKEEKDLTRLLIKKLQASLPCLTSVQRNTLYKIYVLNKTQSMIAKEEGVTRWAIKNRVDGIYKRLKKFIEEK